MAKTQQEIVRQGYQALVDSFRSLALPGNASEKALPRVTPGVKHLRRVDVRR